MSENEVLLKLLEAYTRDFGRGVARIDYDTMDMLNASTGDIIEIKGKRWTAAKCLPLYPQDEGKGIIRIDGLGRQNAGVEIGNMVSIQKAHLSKFPAKQITVRPLEAMPPIDERYLTDALESQPLIKGDAFTIQYFGGQLKFQVVSIKADGSSRSTGAVVSEQTTFTIMDFDPDAIDHATGQIAEIPEDEECKCHNCETDVNLLDEHCHKCGHKLDTQNIATQLLQEWVSAVDSTDVNRVADLYRDDGLVLGFDDNYEEGIGHGDIISKFDDIKHGSVTPTNLITILSQNPRVFGSVAINSGQCRWHQLMRHVSPLGRYTDEWFSFVYNKDDDGVWKIVSHHRSYYEAPQAMAEE